MRYSILLHYPQTTPEQLGEEAWAAGEREFTAYAATLQAAGVLVGAEVLQPSTSTTTLRTVDGVLQVQDGPFADTKEQLGGTFVVDVPDLDAALDLARRAPSIAWGPVEVRPGATYTVDGVWTPNA